MFSIVRDLNEIIVYLFTDSHPQSQVTGLLWLSDEKLISVGHDGLVKTWSVNF